MCEIITKVCGLATAIDFAIQKKKEGYHLQHIISKCVFGDNKLLVENYEVKLFKYVEE